MAQLTPLPVVPATSQVMAWLLPPAQLIPVALGAVTRKGPAVLVLFSVTMSLLFTPPMMPWLPLFWSRTVTRNFRARVTVGSRSPSTVVLFTRLGRRGK